MTTKRFFRDDVLSVGDIIRYKNKDFRVVRVGLSGANSWRGKYKYDTECNSGNRLLTDDVVAVDNK